MLTKYFFTLGLTLLIEIAIARAFFNEKFIIPAVVLMNLVSHPVFNLTLYILTNYYGWHIGWITIVYFEIGIVVLEALLLIFAGFSRKRSMTLSFCANAASFSIGYVLIVSKVFYPYL
jgi:hypothetical protein